MCTEIFHTSFLELQEPEILCITSECFYLSFISDFDHQPTKHSFIFLINTEKLQCGILRIKNSPHSLESILNRAFFFCLKQVLVQLHPSKLRAVTTNATGTKVPIVSYSIVCVGHTAICGRLRTASDFILFQTQCGSCCLVWPEGQ